MTPITGLMAELRRRIEETREYCPSCGYTEQDARLHLDHGRCKNDGNAPWQKKSASERRRTRAALARLEADYEDVRRLAAESREIEERQK
jgi:hypothetical protein